MNPVEIILAVSLLANLALAFVAMRKRAMLPTIKASDFDLSRVEPIAVAIMQTDDGMFLANPETGKRIEFTGCTAWSGHMAPQIGKAVIQFADLPVWPGQDVPRENFGEILLEHVPIMN